MIINGPWEVNEHPSSDPTFGGLENLGVAAGPGRLGQGRARRSVATTT